MADSKQTTPDCMADSKQPTPDSTVADSQNVDIFSKIPISEFLKKYGIGRDPLYGRMRYLQITTYKIKNKAYLDGRQAAHMDGLHEHIKATGRMEGYPIPEPSGPVAEEIHQTVVDGNEDKQQQTVTVNEDNQGTSAITVSSEQALNVSTDESVETVRSHEVSQMRTLGEQVLNNAQNKAAGILIAENMLAQQFIENPDMLPEELKAKIQQSAEVPGVDPFAYANALVNFAKKPGVVAA
ncbi:MAG: hypothetical protein HC903_30585 [Methylacidiphilales bacterium]|nr:hypothetical protein [Candidatus Methylacidiphilales bacterium]NJR15228.1 hypothetical protein [Calothrix sp. CSU_2_0]